MSSPIRCIIIDHAMIEDDITFQAIFKDSIYFGHMSKKVNSSIPPKRTDIISARWYLPESSPLSTLFILQNPKLPIVEVDNV